MKDAVKILLVDDDEVDRETIIRNVAKAGLTNMIATASNGEEALRTLRGSDKQQPLDRPYVVFLDLNMPVMNGFEFLAELRSDPLLHDVTVLVLTTSNAPEDRVKALTLDTAGFVTKSTVAEDFSVLLNFLDSFWSIVGQPQ